MVRRHPPDHNDPTTWLHRGEVAKLLGTTRNVVKKLQLEGALHPLKDSRGDLLYDPDEVHAYALAHPKLGRKLYDDGDITAAAFKLFEEGKTRRQVVMTLRITCDRADALYAEWKRDDFDEVLAEKRAAETRATAEREAQRRETRRKRIFDTIKSLRTVTNPPRR